MRYFETLPKTIGNDGTNLIIMTNLMAKASIIPELLKNPLLYYSYDIQDTDTPEVVAAKYYGTSDRFWIVMFSNQYIDPQWDWPLSYGNFIRYLNDRYGSPQAAMANTSHYEKYVTTTDNFSGKTTTITTKIDQYEYANTTIFSTTYTLPTGYTVTESVNKAAISVYDSELRANEAKRSIKLLNSNFVGVIEEQLKTVMGK